MELSLCDLKHLLRQDPVSCGDLFEVGKAYFIATVTNYYTGKCVRADGLAVWLDDAAWIAYTGRLADAMKSGTFDEVEPYVGTIRVHLMAIVESHEWKLALPISQR